jgi:signal transduction histidine kinase
MHLENDPATEDLSAVKTKLQLVAEKAGGPPEPMRDLDLTEPALPALAPGFAVEAAEGLPSANVPDATEKAPADLNRAIETTLLIARNEYKYVATVQLHRGEIPEIVCNVGELSQVFLILIVNAAHALADAGRDVESGRIMIRTALVDGWAQLQIEDNGCGIPQAIIDKIFDPFFTTKEVGRGSGQGLAIARAIIVDKHSGRIGVDSTPGVGTCFTLRLPVGGSAGERSS